MRHHRSVSYSAYKSMLCANCQTRMKFPVVGYDGVATSRPIDKWRFRLPAGLCYVTTLRKQFARFCGSARKQYNYCRWKKTAMAGYGWGVVYRPQQWSSLLAEGYKTVMNVNYRDMGAIMPRQLATLCLVQLVCNLKKVRPKTTE